MKTKTPMYNEKLTHIYQNKNILQKFVFMLKINLFSFGFDQYCTVHTAGLLRKPNNAMF